MSEPVNVSEQQLILVDENDQAVGTLDKGACHDAQGILHRAFSLFVFNPAGELLLQQRAAGKRLWPGYWSNSCCSHPRHGESMLQAVTRRSQQELGIQVEPSFVYKFIYQASFGELGSEHEFCSVFLSRQTNDQVLPNATEIDAWRWISPQALDAELEADAARFTPWFKLEWQRLKTQFGDELTRCGVTY